VRTGGKRREISSGKTTERRKNKVREALKGPDGEKNHLLPYCKVKSCIAKDSGIGREEGESTKGCGATDGGEEERSSSGKRLRERLTKNCRPGKKYKSGVFKEERTKRNLEKGRRRSKEAALTGGEERKKARRPKAKKKVRDRSIVRCCKEKENGRVKSYGERREEGAIMGSH